MIITGVKGVDFGRHWDERKLMKSVRDSVLRGELLPGWYNYPSMIYDLVVVGASPEIITSYFRTRSEFASRMDEWLVGQALLLRSRKIFLVLVSLSIVWVYLLLVNRTGQWTFSLLGAAILGASWEVAYHARWLAPDGLLMQFGILSLLLVFLALGSSGKQKLIWLALAAVAAGLACGTKYYGGVFLLPIFIGVFKLLKEQNSKWREYVILYILLTGIFVFSFLITTPGALLDLSLFIQDIEFEINHYRDGHRGYTVDPGGEHALLLFHYLFGVFFSRYLWISIFFAIFAFVGLYVLLKNGWKNYETWIFLSVPLFYIPFMTQQNVMMARSYLLLFPFLAILSVMGIRAVWQSKLMQSNGWIRYLIIVGVALGLLVNFKWIYDSAESIALRETVDQSQALQSYLRTHNETNFFLSNKAKRLISGNNMELQNVVSDPSQATVYVFLSNELKSPEANHMGVYNPIFGPYEVNFDYYPSWEGDSRVITMPMETALLQNQFELSVE